MEGIALGVIAVFLATSVLVSRLTKLLIVRNVIVKQYKEDE